MDKSKIEKVLSNVLSKVSSLKTVQKNEFLKQMISDTQEELDNHEFRVTVVGEFSSGKSTFLNAIIGKDILPHAVEETTATITYIHNVQDTDDLCNKAVIHFNDPKRADEVIAIDRELDKFQNYLSALNKNGNNIVKLVQSVDVFVHFKGIKDPICLVDTPGLNGTADGHRDITYREIKRSHASVCLFHYRGMGNTDKSFMKDLMRFQDTFFFVINHFDERHEAEETAESKINSFKQTLKNELYDGKVTPKRVYGVSALYALVSRDKDIQYLYKEDEDKGRVITEEKREECWKQSGFSELENDLFQYLNGSDKEKQFYETVIYRLESCFEDLIESNVRKRRLYNAKIEDVPEKKILEEALAEIKQIEASNRIVLNNQLGADIDRLSRKVNETLAEDCRSALGGVLKELDAINTIDSLQKAIETNKFGSMASSFQARESDKLKANINNGLDEIYENLLVTIKKKVPVLNFKNVEVRNEANITFNPGAYQSNSTIQEYEDMLNQSKEDLATIEGDQRRKLAEAQRNISSADARISSIRANRENSIRNLGYRPDVEVYTKRVQVGTRRVKQEGIGGFFKRAFTFGCCGYEDVPIYETQYIRDDSEALDWDRRKRAIESQASSDISKAEREKASYEMLKREALVDDEKMKRELESKISEYDRKISALKASQQRDIELARTKYLENQKISITQQIQTWFSSNGSIQSTLQTGIRNNLNTCHQVLQQDIQDMFTRKIKEYQDEVNIILNSLMNAGDQKQNREELALLDNEINQVNALIKEFENIKKNIA